MNLLTPFLRAIKVWVGNTLIGERKGIQFQAGSNITLAATDDPTAERVTITITGSGSSGGDAYSAVSDGTTTVSASGNETLLLTSPNNTIQITAVPGAPDRVEFQVGSHTHAAGNITSGRFTQARMPTSSTANRFLVVRTANANPTYDAILASDLPSHTHTRSQITDFPHQSTHQAGGSDELTGNLNAVARTTVRVNNGSDIGSRRRIHFIAGSNVTISASDDSANEEVDITINASSSVSLDYFQQWLTNDYTISQNNQWYDVLSITLPIGVWLITAQALVYVPSTGPRVWLARLYDLNNFIARHVSVQTAAGLSTDDAYIPLQIVTLLEIPLQSTILLQVRSEMGTSSGTVRGVQNSWSPVSPTWIKAVKVAPFQY